MTRSRSMFLALLLSACSPTAGVVSTEAVAEGGPTVGQPAPDFTLTDTDGQTVKLAELRGKNVAIEWFNPDCPFIVAAHKGGPLEALPQEWVDRGGVWLSINSNAAGKQGHGQQRNATAKAEYSLPTAVLLDEDGAVGRLYDARTTPQMFLVDTAGTLVYAGGLDNAPRGRAPKSGLQPWFKEALAAVEAGKPPSPSQTKPYGCSVKYADG